LAGDEDTALRIDKWLWRARFFKARSGAAAAAEKGFRLNGDRSQKAHQRIRPGDVLTFRQAGEVRVVRVLALGERRGSAAEAAALYLDLEPEAGD